MAQFRDAAEAAVGLQDDSGFWHHVLDDTESPLETSCPLMMVYGFMKGVDMGLLDDEETYEEAARRGMEAASGLVDDEGRVRRVAKPPGGPEVPLGVTSYGQGWFLLASQYFV